jgi:hypothetical protein
VKKLHDLVDLVGLVLDELAAVLQVDVRVGLHRRGHLVAHLPDVGARRGLVQPGLVQPWLIPGTIWGGAEDRVLFVPSQR